MSRFCEQCGASLQPNENFCSSCGAKVIRDEPKPSPPKSTHVESTSTHVESQSTPAENHMGKFIALIGILGIIFAGIYLSTDRQSSAENSLGGFYIGMDRSEVIDKFGTGFHSDDGEWYEYGDFWLTFNSTGRLRKILCWDERILTQKGIHLGSTLDEVKRAYGNGYEFDNTAFKVEPAYIYTVGNNKLFFFIDTATDTVCGIRLEASYF